MVHITIYWECNNYGKLVIKSCQVSNLSKGKSFIKLIVNLDTMIKNVKHVGLNIIIVTVFLNTQVLKMIL